VAGQSWADFRLEVFGEPYMVWHDGPDFAEFQRRAKADPTAVEQLVLQGLAETDALAAQAMAEADFPAAARGRMVRALEDAIDRNKSTFRVRVAESLTRLTGEQHWSDAIIDVLDGGPFWGDRLDAASALGRYEPTVERIAALARGVSDQDFLVRYHSANALLRYAGSTEDVSTDSELFAQIASESTTQSRLLAAATLSGRAAAAMRMRGG
jgi:hypothetical protein